MRSPPWHAASERLDCKPQGGFTLVEITLVVAIITILAAILIPAMNVFWKKAKMVEGETMMTELQRLENRYFADNLQYTNNFQQLAFDTSSVKYYKSVSVQIGGNDSITGNPVLYQAIATANLDGDPDLDAWVLTMNTNGAYTIQHGCIPGGTGTVQIGCTD